MPNSTQLIVQTAINHLTEDIAAVAPLPDDTSHNLVVALNQMTNAKILLGDYLDGLTE